MKVLSIGMDRRMFEEGSAVSARQKEYAGKMDELHIIVFSLKKHNLKFKKIGNLYLYPANSSNRISFLFNAYRLGVKIIKQNNFSSKNSVISATDPMTVVAYVLSKRFRIPFQMEIHTDLYDRNFKNSLVTWKSFWYSGWVQVMLNRFLIPQADGLRVVSEQIKQSITKRFKNLKAEPDILPVFVDVEKIFKQTATYYTPDRLPGSIIMVSRFTKEKRIDIGLGVFKKVIDLQNKEVSLTIIGAGPEKRNLESKIKELGIEDKAQILEWENDVIAVYKKADILLVTSEYEGYGMTLIEAGASGLPIVTTNVGIAKTDLFKNGENSFVCPVGDVDCLANSIVDLLEKPELRKLFKEKMQDSIKERAISKEEYVNNYVKLLENLISQ